MKDAINNAQTEAMEKPAKSQWIPIETAPKDAKDLLLFCPWLEVCSGGRWFADQYAKRPRPYWTHLGRYIWGISVVRNHQPTHWMPCPAPPASYGYASSVTQTEPAK